MAVAIFTRAAKAQDAAAATSLLHSPTTLRVLVPTDYNDSADQLATLAQIAQTLPPRHIKVSPGDTLSAIMVREYGFGEQRDRSPATYRLIEDRILQLNSLRSPAEIAPGDLLVPTLPRKARPYRTATNPINDRNKIVSYEVEAALEPGELRRHLRAAPVDSIDSSLGGSTSTVVSLAGISQVTAAAIEKSLQGLVPTAVDHFAIQLQWADGPQPECTPAQCQVALPDDGALVATLTPGESQQLGQVLREAPRRRVVLFILDSGWPVGEATRSRAVLYSMINDARGLLGETKVTPRPIAVPAATHSHVEWIERGLREYTRLDPQRHISIVYVPLSRDQGASDDLRELFTVHYLSRQMRLENKRLRLKDSDTLGPASRQAARAQASTVLSSIPTQCPPLGLATTDVAIIDALFTLAELARLRDPETAFFLNESWTLPNRLLIPEETPQPSGLVVAAAGNDNRNINAEPIVDFAARALESPHVLAVTNMRPKQVHSCCTAWLDDATENLEAEAVLGYDGFVTEQCCGTSFAAPRVAWLLSLAEAYRSTAWKPLAWINSEHRFLKSIRSAADRREGLQLDVPKLLNAIHP